MRFSQTHTESIDITLCEKRKRKKEEDKGEKGIFGTAKVLKNERINGFYKGYKWNGSSFKFI